MASFNVLHDFEIPADAALKLLAPGAVYLKGHSVTGLTAAEAGELLLLAPEGTFEPVDKEADTVNEWAATKRLELSGNVSVDGAVETGKDE